MVPSAAEQGFAPAQDDLAFFYFKGIGVPRDYSKAAHWVRLAAEQGFAHAQTNLASLYETGKWVPLDYVAAYTWYSRAIAAGDKSGADQRKSIAHILTRKQRGEADALLAADSLPPPQQSSQTRAGEVSFVWDY
jgi:uncharacterized protein